MLTLMEWWITNLLFYSVRSNRKYIGGADNVTFHDAILQGQSVTKQTF